MKQLVCGKLVIQNKKLIKFSNTGTNFFSAIFRILIQKWANLVNEWKYGSLLKIPYTVFLMLLGMIMAAVGIAAPKVR